MVGYAADVFVVHSYHPEYPWLQTYYKAFKAKLETEQLDDFYLDTKRLPEKAFRLQAEKALAQIRKAQPKVVVLADDNALKYVGPLVKGSGFPVVFLGINSNPRYYVDVDDQVAGMLERPLMKDCITVLMRVQPDFRKILVLMDNGVTSQAILETVWSNKKTSKIGWAHIDLVMTSDLSEWKNAVRTARSKGYHAVLMGNYARMMTDAGKPVSVREVSEWTSQHSDLPVFSFWRYGISDRMAIGGFVMSGAEQGSGAAQIVNRYLKLRRFLPPAIRTPSQGEYIFSRTQLKRWQIELPEDIARKTQWRD